MFSKMFSSRVLFVAVFAVGCATAETAGAASCVWRVSGPNGATLYLGGSMHALRSTDYPLPSAYNRAFDASTRLAFETDQKVSTRAVQDIQKAGQYPRGDNLKNHVDPRTYDYLRRLFGLIKIPEEKFINLRPWYLSLLIQSGGAGGFSSSLGVERFLSQRAKANSKPVEGLESSREHIEVFSGLNDRQSEAVLLMTFIIPDKKDNSGTSVTDAWRRGDADAMTRVTLESFRDFPAMGERLLGARNRAWIPKIEGYLRSGQTYFVVAGAAHMGGSDGLVALLRARGYKIEQL
jgi:uncharacterized protein YbaP (TraB family)